MSNTFSKTKAPAEDCPQTCLKLNLRTRSQVISNQPNKNSKAKLIVRKSVSQDMKLFCKQTVVLKRLSPNVIKKYDKHLYKKYSQQLKAENALNQCSKLKHSLIKVNESPQRMRLWPISSPLKVSTTYSLSPNGFEVQQNLNFDEHESSLMNCSEYSRYLNLISVKEAKRIPLQQLKSSFNIRNIGKTEFVKRNHSNNIVINGPQLINNLFNNYQPKNLELKPKKKKKVKPKKKNLTINKIKQKYKLIERRKSNFAKQLKQRYIKCLTTFPLASPMGQRVYQSLNNQKLEANQIQSIIRKNESFCSTKFRLRISPETKKYNKWKSHNIERIAFGTDFSRSGLSDTCHQYMFNRRQRLEKMKRLETGINWRSRLLAMSCQNCSVQLKRSDLCAIRKVVPEDSHSCYTSERKCDLNLDATKSQIKVPTNDSTNDAKQETKVLSKRTTNSEQSDKENNEVQNPFVKIERMDLESIRKVLKINLDEAEINKIIKIDLDNKEEANRVVKINLDVSF